MNLLAERPNNKVSVVLNDDNPIIIKNDEFDLIKERLSDNFYKAAKGSNLTAEETEHFLRLLEKVYLEKRAKHFFVNRLDNMNKILFNLKKCVSNPNRSEESTKLYYYNSTKHYLKNE